MIYRAYVRHPSGRVEDKTTTYAPEVAELAFRLLLRRAGIYPPGSVAILNGRRGPEGRETIRLEAVELGGPVDPSMAIRLHPSPGAGEEGGNDE